MLLFDLLPRITLACRNFALSIRVDKQPEQETNSKKILVEKIIAQIEPSPVGIWATMNSREPTRLN